jgi:uncharacterized DUF497 family protein
MGDVIFGDFEWDAAKAATNLRKHGVSFEEAASVFSDFNYVLVADPSGSDRYVALGYSSLHWSDYSWWSIASVLSGSESLAHAAPRNQKQQTMADKFDKAGPTDPAQESLDEIPEVDFSNGIRPNRYAKLRGDFKHQVQLDPELWEHFGSQEKVVEALRLLVELAKKGAA